MTQYKIFSLISYMYTYKGNSYWGQEQCLFKDCMEPILHAPICLHGVVLN